MKGVCKMKWLLQFCLVCLLFLFPSFTAAQTYDSTGVYRRGVVDSLKSELDKFENAYRLFKARTDSTQEFTESDQEELEKLSETLERIGEEIKETSEKAAQLANEAAHVYDIEDAVVYNGDYTLGSDGVVKTGVKVLNGDAFISGTIDGSLVVVNGNAYVRGSANIGGDVVVVNGKAHVSNEATIGGNVIERGGGELEKRGEFVRGLRITDHPGIWHRPSFVFERVAANYNRVDGLFLGLGQNKDYYWSGAESFSPYGFLGYAFALHRWRYELGLDKWFGNENRFEVGVEGHSLTDSKDYWLIDPKENSFFAILAKEDYMDYYSREGVSFHVAQYYQMNSRIVLSYDVDKYSSLAQRTNWSIFGGHKIFRPNPPIDPGWMRSIVVNLEHRYYTGGRDRKQGWIAGLRGEATVGGDYDFRMLSLNAVRYQPLFRGLQLNMRLVGGTANGVLPLQRSYQIGGFNTLNAFPYKEFTGNRMLLFNYEFIFNPMLFKHSHLFPLNTFTLLLFGDIGQVGNASPSAGMASGWQMMKLNQFKSDYGFGIGTGDGAFCIYLAWRTDIAASPAFGVRLASPF